MENLDHIPFSLVGQSTWNELANKLDPELVLGNNWRVLADNLGYSTEQILNIDARQSGHGRNTLKLFEDYIKRNGNSVGAVMKALKSMERTDAAEVLESHLPDIHDRYRKNRQEFERYRFPIQNSCYEPSMHRESLGFHGTGFPQPPPAHCNNNIYSHMHRKNSYPVCASTLSHVRNDLSRNGDTRLSRVSNATKDYNLTSSSYTNNHRSPTEDYTSLSIPDSASKIVHIDQSEHYTSDDVDMDVGYPHQEEGQPIAAAIQRDQNYRMNMTKRPLNQNHMGDGESPPVHAKRPDLRLNINPDMMHKSNLISPSPTPPSAKEIPLAQLDHFTRSEIFKPSSEYNNIMQEKNRREYEQGRKAQNKDLKLQLPPYHNGRILDFHMKSAVSADGARKLDIEAPKTFPLRNKEFAVYPSTKDRPSLLKYSQSVPDDMKPSEYRKAYKHIKVFVTYAGDSKKHIQKVLNLCRCLEKNGFTCCMDMFDKRMPQEEIQNRQEWCAQRYIESDFVLMCVSRQYKIEVDMYESQQMIDDSELHIQYIYSLMLKEVNQVGARSTKAIPLLFEGSAEDDIPEWLRNNYVYKWPHQYRDLLWCLTKPHTRIKPRPMQNYSSVPSSPVGGPHMS